jgi:hypothetical protein
VILTPEPSHDPKLHLPGRELPEGAERLGDGSEAAQVQVGADRRHDQVVGARQEVRHGKNAAAPIRASIPYRGGQELAQVHGAWQHGAAPSPTPLSLSTLSL